MLTQNDIKSAINSKFTDFSNAVKQELRVKLASHEDIVGYKSEFDRVTDLKQSFAGINGSPGA